MRFGIYRGGERIHAPQPQDDPDFQAVLTIAEALDDSNPSKSAILGAAKALAARAMAAERGTATAEHYRAALQALASLAPTVCVTGGLVDSIRMGTGSGGQTSYGRAGAKVGYVSIDATRIIEGVSPADSKQHVWGIALTANGHPEKSPMSPETLVASIRTCDGEATHPTPTPMTLADELAMATLYVAAATETQLAAAARS